MHVFGCSCVQDPGVQGYGGTLFKQLRDEADEMFCKLPPPTPSVRPTPAARSYVFVVVYSASIRWGVQASLLTVLALFL